MRRDARRPGRPPAAGGRQHAQPSAQERPRRAQRDPRGEGNGSPVRRRVGPARAVGRPPRGGWRRCNVLGVPRPAIESQPAAGRGITVDVPASGCAVAKVSLSPADGTRDQGTPSAVKSAIRPVVCDVKPGAARRDAGRCRAATPSTPSMAPRGLAFDDQGAVLPVRLRRRFSRTVVHRAGTDGATMDTPSPAPSWTASAAPGSSAGPDPDGARGIRVARGPTAATPGRSPATVRFRPVAAGDPTLAVAPALSCAPSGGCSYCRIRPPSGRDRSCRVARCSASASAMSMAVS